MKTIFRIHNNKLSVSGRLNTPASFSWGRMQKSHTMGGGPDCSFVTRFGGWLLVYDVKPCFDLRWSRYYLKFWNSSLF